MKPFLLITLLAVTFNVSASDFYWINGSGNYNDGSHWSNTSGGAACNCVPGINDDVFFDANSNLSSQSVNLGGEIFCHSFTWDVTGYSGFLYGSNTDTLHISGSLKVLSPVQAYNFYSVLSFESVTAETIRSSGAVFKCNFLFNGSENSSWALQDSLTAENIYLNKGLLNTNGKTVYVKNLSGLSNGKSIFDISNSTIFINEDWTINDSISLVAANSTLLFLCTKTGSYPYAQSSMLNGGNGIIYNDVIFIGDAYIACDSGNTFHNLTLSGNGTIVNTKSNLFLNDLTLEPGKEYHISGTQVINGNLNADGTPGNLTTIKGGVYNGDESKAIFSKSAGMVCVDFVTLQNATGAGGATFYAGTNSNDLGDNAGWMFQECGTNNSHISTDLYWIGNSGNFADTAHWSLTSGGVSCGCTPTMFDNIFFDSNSFSSTYQTVTVNKYSFCQNITCSGVLKTSEIYFPINSYDSPLSPLYIFGSADISTITMSSNYPAVYAAVLIFKSGKQENIIIKGNITKCALHFDGGPDAEWTVQDSLMMDGDIFLDKGKLFNVNGKYVSVGSLSTSNIFSKLDISNSLIDLNSKWTSMWYVQNTNKVVTTNSTINLSSANYYNKAIFTGGNHTYNDVNFSAGGEIDDANRFHDVVFAAGGFVAGGCSFHDLTMGINGNFASGRLSPLDTITHQLSLEGYAFEISGKQIIQGELNLRGLFGALVNLWGQPGSFEKASGVVCIDSADISSMSVAGGALFYAGKHSIDNGGNSGWIFDECNSTTGILPNDKSDESVTIYPNPSEGNFTIHLDQKTNAVHVEIYDMLGDRIYFEDFAGKHKNINCNISAGIYFVKITDGQNQFNQKLIIQ